MMHFVTNFWASTCQAMMNRNQESDCEDWLILQCMTEIWLAHSWRKCIKVQELILDLFVKIQICGIDDVSIM